MAGRSRGFFGLLALVFCLLLSLSGCAANGGGSYRQVTAAEAEALMETEEGYLILDVRTKEEYAAGHIPGAVCVPNETIGETPPPELPGKDQLILVYCRTGRRSKEAAGKLAALGYTNVVEFGGINGWPGDVVTQTP